MIAPNELKKDFGRMMQLAQQGFHCSEIILFMGLEAQGKTDPDLIRAVSGLAGGIGFSGDVCGAVTGGACLLGLYAGKGVADEDENPTLRIMVSELLDWFSQEQTEQGGGIHCRDILNEDPRNIQAKCPAIVSGVYLKVRSILDDHGIDWGAAPRITTSRQETAACRSGCPVTAGI
jgi:C_GCAxxG_C_C family probable redox protein